LLGKSFWLPIATLWQRELVRFWREKARVLGFVGSPLIFWLVIGSGFGNLKFFFPGALTLTVMFSAVFSTMSLIEDRREGFLLSMLVSPAPRSSMVLGKTLGSLISVTLTLLGFLIAWQMDSAQGFHAIMNLVLVPLWMVSGSLFSMENAHGWIRLVMVVNPLTYSVAALRRLLETEVSAETPGLAASLLVTAACAVVLLIASAVAATRKSARSSA
jgi:ABC-2 type transport system permease protein